ncbi:MAG: hypothetical protein E6J91_32605 [Deltaproteobacteria bacterium]|nr:MAG: hypothetical protein E6J91_32605 [Deltaproteobacteria bacterium]
MVDAEQVGRDHRLGARAGGRVERHDERREVVGAGEVVLVGIVAGLGLLRAEERAVAVAERAVRVALDGGPQRLGGDAGPVLLAVEEPADEEVVPADQPVERAPGGGRVAGLAGDGVHAGERERGLAGVVQELGGLVGRAGLDVVEVAERAVGALHGEQPRGEPLGQREVAVVVGRALVLGERDDGERGRAEMGGRFAAIEHAVVRGAVGEHAGAAAAGEQVGQVRERALDRLAQPALARDAVELGEEVGRAGVARHAVRAAGAHRVARRAGPQVVLVDVAAVGREVGDQVAPAAQRRLAQRPGRQHGRRRQPAHQRQRRARVIDRLDEAVGAEAVQRGRRDRGRGAGAAGQELADPGQIGPHGEIGHRLRRALGGQELVAGQLVRQEQHRPAADVGADALDAGVDRQHVGDAGDREVVDEPAATAEPAGAGDDVDLEPRGGAIGRRQRADLERSAHRLGGG